MKHLLIVIGVMLFALPLEASEDKPVVVTPVTTTAVTAGGQPITLPQGNVQVAVSTYEIAANARLPEHNIHFPAMAMFCRERCGLPTPRPGRARSTRPATSSLKRWASGTRPPMKVQSRSSCSSSI
jgi:hypothetical protein